MISKTVGSIFYTLFYYYVTRRELKTETSKYTKSNFIFLETDDG
jgi:hypothetical protein